MHTIYLYTQTWGQFSVSGGLWEETGVATEKKAWQQKSSRNSKIKFG